MTLGGPESCIIFYLRAAIDGDKVWGNYTNGQLLYT